MQVALECEIRAEALIVFFSEMVKEFLEKGVSVYNVEGEKSYGRRTECHLLLLFLPHFL